MQHNMLPFLTAAGFALIVTCAITPIVRTIAKKNGFVDRPDLIRKLHASAKPLGGGIAIYIAVLLAVAFSCLCYGGQLDITTDDAQFLLGLLLASSIILLTGVADDIIGLGGFQKLAGQTLAIAVFLYLEPHLDHIEAFGLHAKLGYLAIPFAVFWLLGAINSINLLDGADGIATTVGLVVTATSVAISLFSGHNAEAVVSMAMLGALAGFLLFNFPPSSIFLGDAGSMLIGLLIGVLAIRCHVKEAATVALVGPIVLMSIPIIDSTAAIVRRLLTGKNIFAGDHAHLHHVLQRRGLDAKLTVLAVAVLCAIPAAGTILTGITNNFIYAVTGGVIVATVLVTFSFFRNECILVINRIQGIIDSVVFAKKPTRETSSHCLGLGQSSSAQTIWDSVVSFSGEHQLSQIRLNICGEWMKNGQDVVCERRGTSSDRQSSNWSTRVPLIADDREVGSFTLSGKLNQQASREIPRAVVRLVDNLDSPLKQIATERKRRERTDIQKALFINRSYWPDVEASGQLLTDLCETVAEDLNVTVIAGRPNENPDSAKYVVGGTEKRNGVVIRRVRHLKLTKRSIALRAVSLVSFIVMAAWEAFRTPKHDVVVVETDPFFLPLLGAELKRWSNCRLVVYVQDIYPDVAVAIDKVKEGFITRTLRTLLLQAYQRADKIIVLGHDMKQRLIEHGVNPNRIEIIPNWIDTEAVYPIKEDNEFRLQNDLENKFVVMHSGNMGLTQGLEQLIEAAETLKDRSDIVFLIVGGGARKPFLESEVRKRGLKNVVIRPYQPRSQLATSLSAADLHIVSMHASICGVLVPSKIYGIMATATPILAIVPEGTDIAEIVRSEEIGTVVSPNNIQGITEAILSAADGRADLEQQGLRARKLAEEQYDTQINTSKVQRLIHEALGRPSPQTSQSISDEVTICASESDPVID